MASTKRSLKNSLINKDPPANCSAGPEGDDIFIGRLLSWAQRHLHMKAVFLFKYFSLQLPFKPLVCLSPKSITQI